MYLNKNNIKKGDLEFLDVFHKNGSYSPSILECGWGLDMKMTIIKFTSIRSWQSWV